MLRWLEGFDGVSTLALGHGRLYSNTPVEDTTAVNGASVDADEAIYNDNTFLTTNALVGSATNSWIIGFAMRPGSSTAINGTSIPYVALENSTGEQIRVEFLDFVPTSAKPGGLYYKLRIMRGATEIATSDQAFELSTSDESWCYFEFKVTVDNAAGSVEGRYRWVQKSSREPGYITLTWDASVSSIDTQEQATTGADRFTVSWDSGNSNNHLVFDDIYVCDTTGSKNNDFLGKVVIQQQTITTTGGGDGDTTNWALVTATSTEDALQEPHNSVQDDDRITSDTIGQIHLAQQNSLPTEISDSNIIGVRKDLHGRMETSGTLSIGHMWRKTTATAAQTESGTALSVSSTTVEANTVIAEDDPNTGTDWVNADLDTYQFGVKNNG